MMKSEQHSYRMRYVLLKIMGGRLKKKCNDPVRRGEKDILCPFSIHYPYYLSIMTLNFNGCFICGSTTHCNKNISPMKEQSGAIEDFYRELNIH